MGSESRQIQIRAAGEHVEVIDATSKLHGKSGVVAFFVGDNIYVKVSGLRWSPTRMFFREQLRLRVTAQVQPRPSPSRLLRKLRVSLQKMRL